MEQSKEQYKPAEKLELKILDASLPKIFKKVHCPSCEMEVVAGDMDLQQNVAKCAQCNSLFSIAEEVKSVTSQPKMKQEVFRPEGIDLFYYQDDLDIAIKPHLQGLDIFGISLVPAVAMIMIFAYFIKGISIFWPIAFILGSLYFIYKIFNYANYRTYINLNGDFTGIQIRPKNFRKDKRFATDEIDQLYLRHAADGSGHYTIYMIVNGLEGQKHVKLLTVNTLSKAKYLEQEIEKYLKITDRTVPEATV